MIILKLKSEEPQLIISLHPETILHVYMHHVQAITKYPSTVYVDGESFAGLNFRSFDLLKYFAVHWLGALVISIIIKEALV